MSAERFVSSGIHVVVDTVPIKTNGAETVEAEQLKRQAEIVVTNLVPVEVPYVRGTCIDERKRKALRSGKPTEPRPSVLGGPDIHALATAELIGYFPEGDETSGTDRLGHVKRVINAAGILSGGHENCAANNNLAAWIQTIADTPELVIPYAQRQLGDKYDESLAEEVVGYARAVVRSGRYATWAEARLSSILGDEGDEAIEQLEAVPHEGVTIVRNRINEQTVDQSPLYDSSVVGKGSFIFDDWYAEDIEQALAADSEDAAHKKRLAEHARELAIAAVAGAVPNEELYQMTLTAR